MRRMSECSLLHLTQPGLGVVPGGGRLEVDLVQVAAHTAVLQTLQTTLQRGDLSLQQLHEVLLPELLPVVQLPPQLEVADGSLEQRQPASLSQTRLHHFDKLNGKYFYILAQSQPSASHLMDLVDDLLPGKETGD